MGKIILKPGKLCELCSYFWRRFFPLTASLLLECVLRRGRGQDQLHNLWGPVQNENAGHLFSNSDGEFPDRDCRAVSQAWGPSEHGALCDYTGLEAGPDKGLGPCKLQCSQSCLSLSVGMDDAVAINVCLIWN